MNTNVAQLVGYYNNRMVGYFVDIFVQSFIQYELSVQNECLDASL